MTAQGSQSSCRPLIASRTWVISSSGKHVDKGRFLPHVGEDAQEHAHLSVGIAIVDLTLELANELLGEVEGTVTHLG